jgi:hypothetical protein
MDNAIENIEKVIGAMKDTDDPKVGAVFEKEAEVDFATFCAFVLTQHDNITMEVTKQQESTVYLAYNGPRGTDHVASYIINPGWKKPHGAFGGTRVGSGNPWNKNGISFVKNAFEVRR